MDAYVFTRAEKGDAMRVLELYRSLIGTPGCTWHLDYPDIDIVNQDIDAHALYILKQNGIIVAAAAAGSDDELNELSWCSKNPCDLARIGVVAAKQGQGIGALILNKVVEDVKSRGFDGIRMLVSKNNFAALALYESNGFSCCGETHMYNLDFFCYEMTLV